MVRRSRSADHFPRAEARRPYRIGKNRNMPVKISIPRNLKLRRGRRKGVSVVVASVFMIVVVLITSAMLGTFVFGLMGSYMSPPEVYVDAPACFINGNSTSCQMTLTNQGGQSTSTTGSCSLGSNNGNDTLVGGGTIPAGGSLKGVACVSSGFVLMAGSHVQGSLLLTDGQIVIFFAALG